MSAIGRLQRRGRARALLMLCALLGVGCRSEGGSTPLPANAGFKGTLVYVWGGDLWRLESGSEPRRLTEDGWVRDPAVSPDGMWIAYRSALPDDRNLDAVSRGARHALWLIPATGGEPITITTDLEVSPPQWTPDSRLVYAHRSSLFVSTPGAAPRPIREGISLAGDEHPVEPRVSPAGEGVAYQTCGSQPVSCELWISTHDGQSTRVAEADEVLDYYWVTGSTEGSQSLVYTKLGAGIETRVWSVFDPASQAAQAVQGMHILGLSSPDDQQAVFISAERTLSVIPGPGSTQAIVAPSGDLRGGPFSLLDVAWDADAKHVLFQIEKPLSQWGLWSVPVAGGVARQIVGRSPSRHLTDSAEGRPSVIGVVPRYRLVPIALAMQPDPLTALALALP